MKKQEQQIFMVLHQRKQIEKYNSNVEKNPYVSKDLSILKYSVPEFISNNNLLMSKIREITDAKIEDGGSGAFYIYLKKSQ